MATTNNVAKWCIFCYKKVINDSKQHDYDLNTFYSLLLRFVGESKHKISKLSLLTSSFDCCRDCEYLVTEFRKVYHQMKCLELQLIFKLKTLEEVMKMADRVPSRIKLVKHYFEDDEKEKGKFDSNLEDKLILFKQMRMEILKHCQKGQALSVLQPRVISQRWNETAVPLVSSPQSFDSIRSLSNSNDDAFDELIISKSVDTSEEIEQKSDEAFKKLGTPNEKINTLADSPALGERSILNDSMHAVKRDFVKSSNQQIINGSTNQIVIHTTPECPFSNIVEKSNTKISRHFTCSYCSKKFTQEKYLKSHIWSRHRTSKRRKCKTTKNNLAKFRCGLCNIFCTTYQGIQQHKYSAMHQLLFKRNLKMRMIKTEQTTGRYQKQYQKPSREAQKIKKEILNIAQPVTSTDTGKQSSENSSSDTDYNFSDSCSSSSHDENEELDRISHDKNFYCRLDECKSKIFKRRILFEEHKKLHKRGNFTCNFCDKIESTAIKLSLHECEMHSAIQSSTNTKQNEGIFNCARCPFETKREAAYFKHFASIHLGIYNAKVGKEFYECKICTKKLLNRQHITELHFKTHHDINDLEDQDKQVKKCDESGCNAYFLSTTQLQIHKSLQHSLLKSDLEDNDDDEYAEIEDINGKVSLTCKFCDKTFCSFGFLQRHKRKFHKQTKKKSSLIVESNLPDRIHKYKGLVCPEIKCTKSFHSRIGLETHSKHHGSFACNFCELSMDYAPDLASHENKVHCSTFKEKSPENRTLVRIKCSRCTKTFQFQGLYENHFLNVHLRLPTTFRVCPICKYASTNKQTLSRHTTHSHFVEDMDPSRISRCNQCPAHFRTRIQLVRHKRDIHSSENLDDISPIKCKECDIVLRSEKGLKVHMDQVHSKQSSSSVRSPFNCVLDKCKQAFLAKHLLERHQRLHERGEFQCQFCDDICETVLKLIKHETTTHLSSTPKEKVFSCSRCSYKNRFAGRLQNHFAEVHLKNLPPVTEEDRQMPGKFVCHICELELSYGSDLAVHEAQHKENTGYYINCPRCSNILPKHTYVSHFLRKHLGTSKRKECSICKLHTVQLDTHYKTCHKIEDSSKVYKCEGEDNGCQAYFIKAEQLIRHKHKMHVSEWKCKECGKILKSRITLKSHIRTLHPNSDENPKLRFACNMASCKKKFDTTSELDKHQDLHKKKASSGSTDNVDSQGVVDNLKCEKCGKEYVSKTGLRNHISSVHSEHSYICPECGKVFKMKAGLDNHLLYHKGPNEWKFQCATCGKKCATKINLASHMNTHAKEKPAWVCQFCGNKYAHQHNWRNHMIAKHGNENGVQNKIKVSNSNRLKRKGTKKGDCVLAGK